MTKDALNATATEIALDLLGLGDEIGEVYRTAMIAMFRRVPSLIDDVDVEYRDQLKALLESA